MKDKVVVISGATGSSGPTIARVFAEAGARLAFADRNPAKLNELSKTLNLPANRIHIDPLDLSDPARTQQWSAGVLNRFGQIDVVLHLAGGWRGNSSIADISLADWEFLHEVNILTVLHLMRATANALRASRGRWIMVSSPQAQHPSHGNALYAASKAAAETLTLSLADEFKGSGATANIIQVNAIVTPKMQADEPNKDYSTFVSAEDMAKAMLYVSQPGAGQINGQRLPLFGAA